MDTLQVNVKVNFKPDMTCVLDHPTTDGIVVVQLIQQNLVASMEEYGFNPSGFSLNVEFHHVR